MMQMTRRTVMAAMLAGATTAAAATRHAARAREWHALGEAVKAEMIWAWDLYRQHAWGKDQIAPLSGGFSSFSDMPHHLGLTLIESLDTLWVMGLDDRFRDGVDWVRSHLNFDIDGEVSVFETSIRLVGGLLSAHLAGGDPALLARARDLADRLIPAFATPTGLPYRFINLKTGVRRDARTNPAEIGSYLPEWGMLSRLTGDSRYHDAAKAALVALYRRRSAIDLIPVGIDAVTGEWLDRRATVGSPSDSFYEYLWDSWQLLGDADCLAMYRTCTAAILKHQQHWHQGQLWIADVDCESGAIISNRQEELSAFYGGLLAQGGAIAEGAALTESWASVQSRFGVIPEAYDFATKKPIAVGNPLRPELADAAFNLWLIDRNPRWRAIGMAHFQNMKRWNKARFGYADLADVTSTPKQQADHCPGYWWSEQMKYYYLLFADTPRFNYADNYLTTEGNILRGFIPPARPVG